MSNSLRKVSSLISLLSTVVRFRVQKESFSEPCVLSFADAFTPGGLFFEGATTQEESICRSSGLYQCLEGHELYTRNLEHNPKGVAIHDMLYSPGVPVFRDPITEKLLGKVPTGVIANNFVDCR